MARNNVPEIPTEALPPWIATMRKAAMDAVGVDDIKEIVQAQVKKAKEGDANAMKFVFEQVLGGAQLKGATFIQNVYPTGDRPDEPSDAIPGTPKKLDLIAKRIASGNGAFNKRDRENVDLT